MLVVIGSMLIASIFAFAGLAYAMNSQVFSRNNQDWNAALAAAQAGVDDYIGYLNRNDNYARTPIDCANIALKGPATGPNSCGWTAATAPGWKPVDPGDPAGASFHYDIDTTRLESHGVVEVRSTGRVNGETRTLEVGVGRGGSTDFLYYTDHEDADPDNKLYYPSGMDPRCAQYWWQGRAGNSNRWNCVEITFIGGDVLDGPVHTNDTPLMSRNDDGSRPTFQKGLETADPDCKNAVPGRSSTYGNCDRDGTGANYGSGWPVYAEEKHLPDNSDQFRNYPGCHYTGSTRIKFRADGKMQVWSKESSTTPACGGVAPNGAVVPVPTDQVIYVADGTSGFRQCKSGEIGDSLPLGTYTGRTDVDYSYDLNMTYETRYCGKGNAYIEGVLKGRTTVATANSIIVTGDLVLAGGAAGTDMLGLVAVNSVEVFHPWVDTWTRSCTRWWGCSYRWQDSPDEVNGWPHRYTDPDRAAVYPTKGIQISASIQTLQHSFLVQYYHVGSLQGDLFVRGSIAQEWRGVVGRNYGGSPRWGYLKKYTYDKRLKFASPPYFPQWTNAVWFGKYTGEIAPMYED
jgi:hypothetical protein